MILANTAKSRTQKLKSKGKQLYINAFVHHSGTRVCGNHNSPYSGPLLAAKEVAQSF